MKSSVAVDVVADAGRGGVGPGSLRSAATFHVFSSQTSETVSVRHDCCGSAVAPLPTIPTRQIATVAAARSEPIDAIADRRGPQDDDGLGRGSDAKLRPRLLRGCDVRADECPRVPPTK